MIGWLVAYTNGLLLEATGWSFDNDNRLVSRVHQVFIVGDD